MIEKSERPRPSISEIERTNRPEPKSERPDQDSSFDDAAAAIAAAFMAHALRPPELRFDDQSRIGGLDFESQAVSSMDGLKFSSSEMIVNALADFMVNHAADIEKQGSAGAKEGLKVLDNFVRRAAQFHAMQQGRS